MFEILPIGQDSAPENPDDGQVYYNRIYHNFYMYLNDTWIALSTPAMAFESDFLLEAMATASDSDAFTTGDFK